MRFSSRVARLGGDGAAAWDIHSRAVERTRQGDDVILLSIGDPDFDTPPAIVDSAIAGLRGGNTHYNDVVGDPPLRRAIARQHTMLSGLETAPEQVAVFSGAQNALFAAAMCLLDEGDEVIAPEPMYVTYEAFLGASGARLARVPSPRDNGFHFDPMAIQAAVNGSTRAILLNTPNNPTGAVLTRAELEAVAEICCKHDLWLISDEVYASLTFEAEHISPCSLPGMAERTVTVSSLSKSHAMTGWRVGWTVSPPELVEHFENLALCMLYGGPGFVHDGAVAALTLDLPEVAAMKAEIRARRDLVCGLLANLPGLECLLPDAGMFVMVDIRASGLSAHDYASRLLDEQAVSVLPADAFGPSAQGHLRLGLCTSQETLRAACERIATFALSLQG
ncbi:MAG: aminotransferase class I/II-fold pyridoxal phosphate-dependent enzyme [Proteobacteria bacterium]|nr:aminotransferase class I/II-fold pyridoxal phosphate-dependent enzyme [Pseudomonadota bacterium]